MHRPLILKRSELAHAGFEDFDVLATDKPVCLANSLSVT
jgi:hypothetical protein